MSYFNHVLCINLFLPEQSNIDGGTQCDMEVKSQGISFSTSILHL